MADQEIKPQFDGQPVAIVGCETASPELKGLFARQGISMIISPYVPPGTAYVLPHGVPHYRSQEERHAGDAQDAEAGPEVG